MILANHPLLRRWLVRIGIALGALLAALLLLLWAATGALGRWAVMQIADGRELPRGLVLEIEGLRGNVLSRPSAERIALRDAEGGFLVIEDALIRWDGLALLSGDIDVEAFTAEQLDLARRPSLTPSAGSGGSLPSVRIGHIRIDQLALGETVLGQAADFSVDGTIRIRDRGRLNLSIARTDVEGDTLSAAVNWSSDGAVDGTFDAFIAGDGPLATLLPLQGYDARLGGELTGSVDAGTGAAAIQLGGSDFAQVEYEWQSGRWSASARIDATRLTGTDLPVDPTGTIEAAGPLTPVALDTLQADGRNWQASIRPMGERRFDTAIALSREIWQQIAGDAISIGRTRWRGTLDLGAGITADGVLEAEGIDAGPVGISALGGAVLFTRRDGQNGLTVDVTATDLTLPGNLPVSSLPWAGLSFTASPGGGEYAIPDFSLTSDLANLAGNLQIAADGLILAGDVSIDVPDLSAFNASLAGPVSADLYIPQLSRQNGQFSFRVRDEGVQWPDSTLATLLAGAQLTGQAETDFNAWQLNGIALDSRNALVRGDANGTGARWSAALDAAMNADIAIDGAVIGGGAAITLEAAGEGLQASGNAVISTPRLEIAGRIIEQPRLGLDFSADRDRQTGEWQIDAITPYGPLQATGEAEHAGTIRLDVADGRLDRFGFTGGFRTTSDGYEAEVSGTGWALPGTDIERLALTARRTGETTRLAANANGSARDPFELAAEAELTGGTIEGTLQGSWADIPIRTIRPIRYAFANENPSASGTLDIGGGQARFGWTAENRLTLAVQDLPAQFAATAAALPEMDGSIDLDLSLQHSAGRWTGDITASANQFRVRQIRAGGALDLNLSGRLGDALSLALDIRGDDLAGEARLVRTGAVTRLGELVNDAPLDGTVSLSGAIEPLVALAMTDTRQLAGMLSADLTLAGTVFRPELSGRTSFENGRYVSEDLGVNIDQVNATALWQDGRLVIELFTASDPRGGQINVTGDAGLGENGWEADAQVRFTNFNAVRRPDLSVVATGEADVGLSASGITVTGSAELNRIDARPPDASAPSFAEIDVTEINRPDGRNGHSRRRIPVTLDYRINADDSIFVSGEAFSTEWRGEWHVTGDVSDLEINGDANLITGRAFLLNRAFRLEEGRVGLSGGVRSAEINLLARHSREGLTVDARISGPVSSPDLALSSQPTLPEDEILARLLFDRNSGQLSPLETATIAAQLSGQNLFGIVGGLRRAAGLDRLDFSAGENGEIIVTGGQQLTDDVYLELESRGAALSSARLEWTLTPDFTLLSRLTGDTEASIALRWRTEYD